MTDKEAIKQLESVTIYHEGKFTREALDIAIKALKRQMTQKPEKEVVALHRENYRAWLDNCWNGKEDDPCQIAFEESIRALEQNIAVEEWKKC